MAAKRKTVKGGIHQMPAAEYHADPCPGPSLSAGTAHRLVNRSPLHAWYGHPRLNPDHQEENGARLDFGSAAHSILLEGIDTCEEVAGFDDWRKQAAKDERDRIRGEGKIPLLGKDLERMRAFTAAVASQLDALELDPRPLCQGKPEQTLIWREGDVWCRARPDWLHDAGDAMDDLKTTGTSADPDTWARQRLFTDGKDIQCALYLRGLRALTGVEADWRFILCEVEPPYALSVITLAASTRELADQKVERAIELWRQCLAEDHWPGYSTEVTRVEAPAWEQTRWLERTWQPDGQEVPA